jgi:endonuclease/exonuclease/phosphatase family metal-dependent hydrolase
MRLAVHHISLFSSLVISILGNGCTYGLCDGVESRKARPSAVNSASKQVLNASSSSSKKASNDGCFAPEPVFRAVTYNAALAPGFELLSKERTPKVIEALARQAASADILCVQEFWERDTFEALKASVPELSHIVRPEPRPGTGTCSETEIGGLAQCVSESCGEANADEVVGCASMNCPEVVGALGGGCLGCIMNHLESPEACLGTGSGPSDPAIFGGNYDVGLLSRHPLARQAQKELSSYFVRAKVLYGRVTIPSFGAVDVFCTHLGSPLGIVKYEGSFGNYELEHQQQVNELISYVREKSNGNHPVIVLGDLNMGPAIGYNEAELPEQFQQLLSAGFDDAYLTSNAPDCTYCAGTSFRDSFLPNQIIDHILTARVPLNYLEVNRLFTEPVTIDTSLPEFNLSDHFGLELNVFAHP